MIDGITPKQFHESEGVEDWRVLGDGACAYFRTGSFAAGARLVQAIGELPGVDDHPPDVDVRHDGVTVRLLTVDRRLLRDEPARRRAGPPDLGGRARGWASPPTRRRSRACSSSRARPSPPRSCRSGGRCSGMSRARDSPDEDLVDPRSRGPAFWFERMEEPRPDGGGAIHVAVWVPYEQAEARVAAALAAGGRMVRDEFAPSWWTLADAAGNEADIATTMGRD